MYLHRILKIYDQKLLQVLLIDHLLFATPIYFYLTTLQKSKLHPFQLVFQILLLKNTKKMKYHTK